MAEQVNWEASKENIQPLKRGRNISFLREALENPEFIETKRSEFEENLRIYDGDDPLVVWDEYFTWIEEHYPCGLHGLQLTHLLENCITVFMNEKKYENDIRFVRVWLKFANLQVHPEEVFKCMSARGIGINCSMLYTEWAEFHELSGEPRKAQEILEKGLQMKAEPIEQLKSSFKQLLLRISQGSTKPEVVEEEVPITETRTAFSKLQVRPKATAPVLRVGESRISFHPGAVHVAPSDGPKKNAKIAIFVDENNASSGLFSGMSSRAGSSLKSHASTSEKENSVKTKKLLKQKQPVRTESGPSFSVVADVDAETPLKTPVASSTCSILSSRKDTSTHMTLSNMLEGPNINEKRMYDFLKVYAGINEFQFEEIRFAKMKRKKLTTTPSETTISGEEE